jgi:hypothetical protein
MSHKTILIKVLIILTSLTFWTSKKDKIICSHEYEFCSFVSKQDFDATGPLIDDFLAGLKNNKTDENLENLLIWLECKDCVISAKIFCNSCIQTFPPQSEIQVVFNNNGQQVTMIMDIIMDEPLKFREYH